VVFLPVELIRKNHRGEREVTWRALFSFAQPIALAAILAKTGASVLNGPDPLVVAQREERRKRDGSQIRRAG
jgi:hypothetical protein